MTESVTTVLSVRGEARLEVPPDSAALSCLVRADEREKATALQTVSARLEAVLDDLRQLGGLARSASDDRQPVTWLARSASSSVETRWDYQREVQVNTGRMLAWVDLRVEVRDFALMDRVGSALVRHETTDVRNVSWRVDADNPGWPEVRSAAIRAAIEKGRDYAVALGGGLERIEHVADVGLLNGGDGHYGEGSVSFATSGAREVSDSGAPSLDPEPQLLHASIEARFSASVPPLA